MKRLTIAEAAQELGVTQDVIKRRITRLELVACQAPEYRECVWIQESLLPLSGNNPKIQQQNMDMVMGTVKEDDEAGGHALESTDLVELKRQLEYIQKRIDELESRDAGPPPMPKE